MIGAMIHRAGRRGLAGFGVLVFAMPLAVAGEWDDEGKKLKEDCGGPFGSLSVLKSCVPFLFYSGKPVRFSVPTSVVPGGGTALGAMFIQPLDIHNWAESNFTLE